MKKRSLATTSDSKEIAFLIGVKRESDERQKALASLKELERLTESAGARVKEKALQELKRIDPAFFIGKGKAQEIQGAISLNNINLAIFDEDLSPAQQRNLENTFNVKVIDRTALILDIFAQRAKSREGKLQVELAQLTYLLPRLRGKGLVLSRLGGGIGTRGPGETQLEVDRRKIRERIYRLKRELEKVRRVRTIQRLGRRLSSPHLIVIVGYTNAGKSTLLNCLTHAGVIVENRLFSTLDPTTRRLKLPSKQDAMISDTVGFLNKLPHQLIAAFKATLEEINQADLLLHIIDISNPEAERQIESVNQVLEEIGAGQKVVIHVLNKVDLLDDPGLVRFWKRRLENSVAISALTGKGIKDLYHLIDSLLTQEMEKVRIKLPLTAGRLISQIHSKGMVTNEEYKGNEVIIEARVNRRLAITLSAYRVR
jgi:GTP-binding protein HflX